MNIFIKYLKEAVNELKKVIWPTKETTINHTIMVIGVSLGVAAFLFVIDTFLQLLLRNALNLI